MLTHGKGELPMAPAHQSARLALKGVPDGTVLHSTPAGARFLSVADSEVPFDLAAGHHCWMRGQEVLK